MRAEAKTDRSGTPAMLGDTGAVSKPASPSAMRVALERNAFLEAQVGRLEAALDNMSQGLCMFDADARLVICNARYRDIFGLAPDTLTPGMTQEEICAILIARGCYPAALSMDQLRTNTLTALTHHNGRPLLRDLADGRVLSILYRSLPAGGWVATFEDVTEQRRNEARISHLARHDGLTDLANARTLRDESGLLDRTATDDEPVLALHYLDLDRFKFVNDTYGHDVGDELLRAVAGRLRTITRSRDRIGRLGGDEFAIIQRVADDAAAEAFARRLVAAVALPYDLSGARVEVGASVGVVTCHGKAADIEALLHDADLAMRQAKAAGRGTVCLFEPAMSEAARLRRSLEAELQTALAAEQFEVHYQPQIDLETQRMIGVEALLRWRHPERGLIAPGAFIAVAEETGLIVALGLWVLRQACRDAARWPRDLVIAVNVSGMQMRQRAFADTVLQVLAETGCAADRLELEITESALLDESDAIMANLDALRAAGVRFAMDDFGTGYSSLSYLRRFPIDKIKIDRSFTKDAETSADALAIIRAVAGLGTSLGMKTVIEGVETVEQLRLAQAEGLNQAQGYLLCRPQPVAVISSMLGQDTG